MNVTLVRPLGADGKKIEGNLSLPKKSDPSEFGYPVVAKSCEEVRPGVFKYGLGYGLKFFKPDGIDISIPGFQIFPDVFICRHGMIMCDSTRIINANDNKEVFIYFYHIMKEFPPYKVGDVIGRLVLTATVPLQIEQEPSPKELEKKRKEEEELRKKRMGLI